MPTIGQLATFSATPVSGATAYVWKFRMNSDAFDYDTIVCGQPASGQVSVAKRLDRGGTLHWSCRAVDALGQVSSAQTGDISVEYLPTISLVSISVNDNLFPYSTVLTVETPLGGTVSWSPAPASGQGTLSATYSVSSDMAVTATVSSSGGTAVLPIEIRGRASRAPLIVVSATPNKIRAGGGSVEYTAIAVDPDGQSLDIAWSGWPGWASPGTPTVDAVGTGKRSRVVLSIPTGATPGPFSAIATATTNTGDSLATAGKAPVTVLGNYAPQVLGVVTSGLTAWGVGTRTLETRKIWPPSGSGETPARPCADYDSALDGSVAPYKWYPNCPEFLAVVYDQDNDDQPITPYGAAVFRVVPGQTTHMISGWVEIMVKFGPYPSSSTGPAVLPTNAPVLLRLASTVGGLAAGDYRGVTVGPFTVEVDGLSGDKTFVQTVWIKSSSVLAGGVADNPAITMWLSAAARPLSYAWTATYSWSGESFTAWPVLRASSPFMYLPLGARRTQQVTSAAIGAGGDKLGTIAGTVGGGDAGCLPISAYTILYRQTAGATSFGSVVQAYQPGHSSAANGANFPGGAVSAFGIDNLRDGVLPSGITYSSGKAQLTFSYVQPRGNRVAVVLTVTDPLGNVVTTGTSGVPGLSTATITWE